MDITGADSVSSSVPADGGRQIEEQDRDVITKASGGPMERQLTVRAVLVGLVVGLIMCCSNMYFGLQSGWVTMGSLQSAVLGYGTFKMFQRCGIGHGFTVGENVIIQTTSVATATLPLAAGFVSIIPALGMLTTDDNPSGPVTLSVGQMMLWSLGLAFFGVFSAIPLRTQTVVREKLRFPSGAATAKVIQVLHQNEKASGQYLPLEEEDESVRQGTDHGLGDEERGDSESTALQPDQGSYRKTASRSLDQNDELDLVKTDELGVSGDWFKSCMALLAAFAVSFVYKLIAELVEVCETVTEGGVQTESCKFIFKEFPVFSWLGWEVATRWGWILSSPFGYVGQGMIMGPKVCVSMLGGALMGFAILGPIARSKGWAPGEIMSLETGARGWVLWLSLAIMLGDSLTSLFFLTIDTALRTRRKHINKEAEEELEPPENRIPSAWWLSGLGVSTVLCTAIVSWLFDMPVYQPLIAVVLAALVAVLAVRALGETDLNPVSGIGKLSQIVFAVVSPGKVVPNIVAGAIAEAGATQAGDMMQDFKTAYLLGVPPRPQIFAQLVGSLVSALASVGAYALFTAAWPVPGKEFKVPTAGIWIDMARLFNGGELPPRAAETAAIGAVAAALLVVTYQILTYRKSTHVLKWLPSGIGFAVGMYVGPEFTLPRVLGSLAEQIWLYVSPASHSVLMVVVASGLVLGEGTAAIVVAIVKAIQSAQ